MNQRYQNNKFRLFLWLVAFCFSGLWANTALSQTTLSTETGTNYTGANGVAANGVVTFVIQNTNSTPIILKQVDAFWNTANTGATPTLWYSATSLSGTPNVSSPTWSVVATGAPVNASANAIIPVITGMGFTIPANTQYRFALQSSLGISYSGTASVIPTPNTFTQDGVSLKVGNAQISGSNVGYGGGFPAPANNPRFFTGRVVFCPYSLPATAPTLTPDTAVCFGSSATLRVTGGTLNTGTDWKWYTGSCGGTLVGTGNTLDIVANTTTTYYVRGEGSGPCGSVGPCASVTVNVLPPPGAPVINTIDPICQGSVAHVVVNPFTLGTVPTPDSITITSAALSIAVPDNTDQGVTTTLTIPALPAGAQVTSVDVTLAMTHTYPGDMIFNLQAPNGTIANLYKYASGQFTGNSGNLTNSGWFNTVITPLSTRPFSAITAAPYNYGTGPFAPDLLNSAVSGPTVQNPAGYASTATSMSQLYSIPAGTWTLAMADGGPGDVGSLTRWSIKIRFNKFQVIPSIPPVWSPAATLYTDAAATVPYDGTSARLDIYAKPSVTTTYTAVSTGSNGCVSAPSTGTVTVYNPASISADPQNTAVCEFGTTSFSVTAGGTTPSYQWQVDINDGNGFTDIANDANYSGATSSSLTVTNMPSSWDGYLYRCAVGSLAPCTAVVPSAAATLTVHPTPVVNLTAAPYTNLLPGLTTTLSVNSNPAAASYSWSKDGAAFTGSTSSSFTAKVDDQGVYNVAVVDINGCTNNSNDLTIADSVSSRLFVYPNPSNGQFSVSYHSLKGNQLPRQLLIYDAKGALVYNETLTVGKPYGRMDIDFSKLSKGVYMINLLDRFGKRIASGKVSIQ